jgi:ATP-dependent Clp protease ATP-binding subunit ClpA
MAIALDRPEVERLRARLADYARLALDRAGSYALQIHADDVGAEHLLATLMDDEECAAHRVAIHAFADPQTIADEARAMASGIMIGGSDRALPFSVHGVRALAAARRRAAVRGDAAIEILHVLLGAFEHLDEVLRTSFDDAGFDPESLERELGPTSSGGVSESGPLFRHFSDEAKRALSAAAKLARQGDSPSVSAAHLLQAGLQSHVRLERVAGIPASRARLLLRGRSDDLVEATGEPLSIDGALEGLLGRVPGGASTVELLAAFHGGDTLELARVLLRHKVTPALIERARTAFQDPCG